MTYFNAGVRRIDKVIKRIRCSGQGSVKGIGKDNSIALCGEIRLYTAGIELLFRYINPNKKRTTYTSPGSIKKQGCLQANPPWSQRFKDPINLVWPKRQRQTENKVRVT